MAKILNREIMVHAFKIEESKVFTGTNKQCLHLQISLGENMHVVFTSSGGLIDAIRQVPQDGFPFSTTIIQDNERFLFT